MRIRRDHDLGLDEAKRRIDAVAAQLGPRFDLRSAWQGDRLEVTGTGVNGHIAVTEEEIEVIVRLGFALMMFERTIRAELEGAIDEHLLEP